MWISKDQWHSSQEAVRRAELDTAVVHGGSLQLKIENTRLRADLDWFKLRLNAVEKERAQLIAAAIGVKVSIPEFMPAKPDNIEDAFHDMPDLSTVGDDAREDDGVPIGAGVDYSQMPGYRKG